MFAKAGGAWVGLRLSALMWTRYRSLARALVAARLITPDQARTAIGAISAHPCGWSAEVRVPLGGSAREFDGALGVLAAGLAAQSIRVEQMTTAAAVRLVVMLRDPLAEPSGPWPLLLSIKEGRVWDLSDPVPVAVDEAGCLVRADMWESSVLIGGQPSSGKSAALWLLALACAADPRAVLLVIDGKHGVELAALRRSGRAERFARNQAEALPVLRELMREVERRYAVIYGQGRRHVEPGNLSLPPIVLFIDELAEVTATGLKEADREAEVLLRRLASISRAAGVTLVCATQKPSADVVATGFRDLQRLRWAMRCGARGQAETILGGEALARGAAPEAIPPGRQHAGTGYLMTEDGELARCRSFYVEDADIEQCLRIAQLRHRQAILNGETPQYGPAGTPTERQGSDDGAEPPVMGAPAQERLPFDVPAVRPRAKRRRLRSQRSTNTAPGGVFQLSFPFP